MVLWDTIGHARRRIQESAAWRARFSRDSSHSQVATPTTTPQIGISTIVMPIPAKRHRMPSASNALG